MSVLGLITTAQTLSSGGVNSVTLPPQNPSIVTLYPHARYSVGRESIYPREFLINTRGVAFVDNLPVNVEILTEDYLMIHPTDAKDNAIQDGDMVCVESARGKVDIKAKITDEVRPGVLSTTFHFPEIMVNNITSDIHDSEAKCPEYKVVSCRIRKAKNVGNRKAGEVVYG